MMVAKRYIDQDKVHFLFGVVSSAVGLALTEVSKQNKKIFIGTDHASTQLTVDKFQPYYFRVSNNTFQSMAAGALYLKEMKQTKPWETICVHRTGLCLRPRPVGRAQGTTWIRFGIKYKVVGEYWPKLFAPDYTPFITSIIKDKPDVLVCGLWGGDTVAFIKQATPYGLFEKTTVLLTRRRRQL